MATSGTIRTIWACRTGPRRGGAFSLVELLVVVGIIALLLAILVPTLGRAKELARRGTCAMNLKGLSQAVTIYGVENRTMLPQFTTANNGAWLWDLSFAFGDAMLACGACRPMFYCPSGLYQDLDTHWWFTTGKRETATYTISGYYWFHRRALTGVAWGPTFLDPKTDPNGRRLLTHLQDQLEVVTAANGTTFKTLGPSELELSSDATISTTVGTQEDFGYTKGASPVPHRTSHMDGKDPAGGNMMFLDGHVSWRTFSEMAKRAWTPNQWW